MNIDADGDGDNEAGTGSDNADLPSDGQIRTYEPNDEAALWALKVRFERELGGLGGDDKGEKYDGKLTDEYENRYGEWVGRCTERDPGCVIVAETGKSNDGERQDDGETTGTLVGYVFVLPEDLSLIWDAAVVNELYVREAARGTGVAEALMDAALSHAREQDIPLKRIVLDVDGGNDRARAFYRRLGFEHWGEMVAREL